MSIRDLFRPEVADFKPYQAANYAPDSIRLNANEMPFRPEADRSERGLNWYPPQRPIELNQTLAAHYGVSDKELLITRGSSEAIDLLIRLFCRPGVDAVVTPEPTFSMYRVYANVHGANVVDLGRGSQESGYQLNSDELIQQWQPEYKLLFLTAPNNPTGTAIAPDALRAVITALRGRAIVVLDAAYCEFSSQNQPQLDWADEPHVVVLRTLSKAYGLAGARCGVLLGSAEVAAKANALFPPYALATPVIEAVMQAFTSSNLERIEVQIQETLSVRDWFAQQIQDLECVAEVFPSDANFLLVRFKSAATIAHRAEQAGLLLRDYSAVPALLGCLRITIGERQVMQRLVDLLAVEPT